jgi:hypothetical protein
LPQTDVLPQPDAGGGATLNAGTGFTPASAPIDASIPQPAEPDPWAAGGYLDESTRAAMRGSGFAEEDPHTAAWGFLNAPVDFFLPTFTLPDLPPEPSFMAGDWGATNYGTYGGDSLTSGFDSGGGDMSFSPPPATSFTPPSDWTPPEPSPGPTNAHGPF